MPLVRLRSFAVFCLSAMVGACGAADIEPYGPTPTAAQVEWQRMEINMFCHFGPNTFTGAEWGSGTEDEEAFCPRQVDCAQWVGTAAEAGMRGIILTAKHHDGYCLWPSAESSHTVAHSPWQQGNGDVLRELRSAIDLHNAAHPSQPLGMGVYLSPWDRHHPAYGTEAYNAAFAATLREVHSQYGPLFEQWFDCANGEGPTGRKQEYDWDLFMQTVQELSPRCVVFSDIGPGCRWVGNEEGYASATNWSTLRTEGATPSSNKPSPDELGTGHRDGSRWAPAEADVSLRKGWFWHPGEEPKSVAELMEIYLGSVGRNALLLLNVPPDTAGRICRADSLRLVEFRRERDRLFAHDLAHEARAKAAHRRGHKASAALDTAYHTFWAAPDTAACFDLYFDSLTACDLLVLQEYIPLGQRITSVEAYADCGAGLQPLEPDGGAICTSVGYKRIVRLAAPSQTLRLRHLQLRIHADAPALLNRIGLYNSTYSTPSLP